MKTANHKRTKKKNDWFYLYYKNLSWIITGTKNVSLIDSWQISFCTTPCFFQIIWDRHLCIDLLSFKRFLAHFHGIQWILIVIFFVILLLEHKSLSPNLHQDLWLFGIVISNWGLSNLLFWELPVHYANECSNYTVHAMTQPIQVMSLTINCHLFQ